MKWINLKLNKCPSCDKKLGYSCFTPEFIICSCKFKISKRCYYEIVNSQVLKELKDKWTAFGIKPCDGSCKKDLNGGFDLMKCGGHEVKISDTQLYRYLRQGGLNHLQATYAMSLRENK